MTWIRALFVLLAAAGIGEASVTVAWKMPVESVAPAFADAPPLEEPPGDSAFFQPGDKLWDLSKRVNWQRPDEAHPDDQGDPFAVTEPGFIDVDWKGDWIVWNPRSGMIVVRGSWHDVLVAEQVLGCGDQPNLIRTRIELKGTGNPRILSLVSRSGEKASFEMNGIRAEVEHASSGDDGIINGRFDVSWPAEGGRSHWRVKTAVALREDEPGRLACQGADGLGWELGVSVVRELLDGTPRKEFRWVETAGGLKPWSASALRGEPLEKRLDADRWLGIHPMAAGPASYLLAQARSHPAADVNAPELAEWTKGYLLNLGTVMEEMGVAFPGKGHFAAMDPLSNRVFVVTDRRNQELAAEWFSGFLDGVVDPPIWIATNPAAGGWGIAAGSGEVAQIQRSGGDEGGGLLFRCEPTRGGDGIMMDLRYSMDVVVGDTKTGRIEGATTLIRDKPQTLGGGSGSEGEEAKVIVTASDAGG